MSNAMSDPLSIAASIAGLVAISAKIVSMLKDLYDCGVRAKQVPESISHLMEEMQDMSIIFCQVQQFILGTTKVPNQSRLRMLSIHHLVAALSGCVLVASNLEKYLSEVVGISDPRSIQAPASNASLFERIKWALWKETEVAVFIEDLQWHKLSLKFMLGIIQCHTAAEASENLEKLHEFVFQILESNRAISIRLRELISRQDPAISDEVKPSKFDNQAKDASILPPKDDFQIPLSTIKDDQVPNDNDDAASFRTAATSRSTFSLRSMRSMRSMHSMRLLRPSFMDELKNSRPHKRIQRWGISDDSYSTFSSSSTICCSWSMLSDVTLGDLDSISEISAIVLPVCLSDLWDSQLYQVEVPLHSTADRYGSRQKLKCSSLRGIHYAIRLGSENVVRTLLALGTDIEGRDSKGLTPLAHAAFRGNENIFKLLLEMGASEEAITSITPQIDLTGCIHKALDSDCNTVVRLLIMMGADIEEKCPTKWNMTPLLQALYCRKAAIARLLIEKGADLFACDDDQWTVVHCAVRCNDPEMLTDILQRGASKIINERGLGGTPLYFSLNSLTLTKILIEHGASPNIQNENKETPYDIARRSYPLEVAVYLWSQLSPEMQAWKSPPARW